MFCARERMSWAQWNDVVDALDRLVDLLGVGKIGGDDLRPHARDARRVTEVAHDAAHLDALLPVSISARRPPMKPVAPVISTLLPAGSSGRAASAVTLAGAMTIRPCRLQRLARLVGALDDIDRLDAVAPVTPPDVRPSLALILKSRSSASNSSGKNCGSIVDPLMPVVREGESVVGAGDDLVLVEVHFDEALACR